MFNKNGKTTELSSTSNSSDVCNIAFGTTIEGNVTVKSNLRLEGTIIGTVSCSGRLVMSTQAQIKGDIFCSNMISEGNVEGNIVVKEKIYLLGTATVIGNVKYQTIQLESGAVINGKLDCVGEVTTSTKKEVSPKDA